VNNVKSYIKESKENESMIMSLLNLLFCARELNIITRRSISSRQSVRISREEIKTTAVTSSDIKTVSFLCYQLFYISLNDKIVLVLPKSTLRE
jgi:hypothetical protein